MYDFVNRNFRRLAGKMFRYDDVLLLALDVENGVLTEDSEAVLAKLEKVTLEPYTLE